MPNHSVSLPALVPPTAEEAASSKAPRRIKNDLQSGTATRAGVCSVPQMTIPYIPDEDPRAELRVGRVNRALEEQERRLARINGSAIGIGKRAVTVDVLAAAVGNTTEFFPKHQLMHGGKPFICRDLKQNEIPTFAGDALFTSTSRADYFWKTRKKRNKDRKNRRPYDDFYKFRDSFLMQKACLRD